MNSFIRTVLARPVAAVVCVLALIIFGVSTITNMELERVPAVTYPTFWVDATYVGAGPEEMDRLITTKLEKACKSLKGFKDLSSSTEDGYAYLTIEYDYGTDLKEAKEELQTIVNNVKSELPQGTELEISQSGTNDESIYSVSIQTKDENVDVRSFVKQKLEPDLKRLDGVSKVDVNGGVERYISVELIPDAIAQYGLDVSSIAELIAASSFTTPAGSVRYGDQTIFVSTIVNIAGTDDIKNIPIKLSSGDVIHIYDIANVRFANKKIDYYYRLNGKDGVSLEIKKKQKANVVNLGKEIRQIIDSAKDANPDLIFTTTKDDSIPIKKSIMNIFYTLFLGIVLSMVVLFLFFGDLKASLIVGSSMPISLFVTFILMGRMGYTLNLVTMSSLVIGIGMMVDNAIVVLEMCFVKKDAGYDFREAAYEGTRFIFTDILASTLTSVVVYLPLVNLKGMAGQQFGPLGWTIMFALVASLVSSLTLVPLAFSIYKPVEKKNIWINKVLEKMGNVYAKFMPHLLKHSIIVAAVSILLVGGSVYLFKDFEFDTSSYAQDYKVVSIMLSFKPGLDIKEKEGIVGHFEELVQKDEDIEYYYSYVSAAFSVIEATVSDKSDATPDEIGERWAQELDGYDDRCNASIGYGMRGAGPSAEIPLTCEDYNVLREALKQVEDVASKIDGVTNVKNAFHSGGFKADVVIDQEMALTRGFSSAKELSDMISAQIQGKKALDVIVDDRTFEARVELPDDMKSDLTFVETMSFRNKDGVYVPFTDIGRIEFKNVPLNIEKSNGKYSGKITASCSEKDIYRVKSELSKEVAKLNLPKGVSVEESASEMQTREAMSETSMAIAAAVFLVFMVMAIEFESFRYSLLVMMCLPFALIGAMPLLYSGLDQKVINLSTMVGFLMLGGIVVNDGIMYVDTTNEYRKDMALNEALISAGRSRMRPILMTTLTTVLSMVPMVIPGAGGDPAMRGLAYVVMGGLTMATILTLIILPIFYRFVCEKGDEDKPVKPESKHMLRHKRRRLETHYLPR